MLNREMIDYSDVQNPKTLMGKYRSSITNKSAFFKRVRISKLKAQNIICWSYYFDNLNFMKEK